jgi:hypothetical protein
MQKIFNYRTVTHITIIDVRTTLVKNGDWHRPLRACLSFHFPSERRLGWMTDVIEGVP